MNSDGSMSEDEGDRRTSKKSSKKREESESEADEKKKSGSESGGDEEPAREERDEKIAKTISVDKDDAAFVLGRGGATKRKIARVAGADIDLDEHSLTITLTGTERQCERAQDYIRYVTQQRVGPVSIREEQRDDFSAVPVPQNCIGFVMGRAGQTLRAMEEEWGVLMFFAKLSTSGDDEEALCIFGSLPSRRGAEIKVLSSIEHKIPGSWVTSKGELRDVERVEGDDDVDGWGTDTVKLSEDNFSYALGAQGATRRKLAAASGCIIEYVGKLACFCGYKKDRRRGKDYMRWLIEQRTGNSVVERPQERDDCLVVKIPVSSIAFLTGHRGESLRAVEKEAGTFCFTDGDRNDRSKKEENLLIFSFSRTARENAADIVEDRLEKHKKIGGRSGGGGREDNRGGNDFGRDRPRERSRSRDRRGGDRRRRDESEDRGSSRRRRDDDSRSRRDDRRSRSRDRDRSRRR